MDIQFSCDRLEMHFFHCFYGDICLVGAGNVRPGVGLHLCKDHVSETLHQYHRHLVDQI